MSKTAIITGCSRGLGLALANKYLEEGFNVIGLSRSNPLITNPNFTYILADLSKPFDWNQIDSSNLDHVELINNAGAIGEISQTWKQNIDEVNSTINVNVSSLIQACIWFTTKFEKGTIINISSGAASSPIPSWAIYCSSKAAVDMFSRTLQAELDESSKEIRVYSIAPGVLDTRMQEEIRSSSKENFSAVDKFSGMHETGDLKSPEHVAELIYSETRNNKNQHVVWSVRELEEY
jgi:benzil reductase ((S)-benzoin forming)